jgi:O-antigen ligase
MQTILSLLIFVVLTYWVGQIYLSGKKKFRAVEVSKGEYYLLSPNMYFVIFTVCTAPIFLGSLALLKYGLWFATMLVLLFVGKVRIKFEFMTVMYSIFFLWLCYTMTYTAVPRDGAMMLIKYALPMLFLWLGYSGLRNEKDLIIFLKVVNIAACIYCGFMGGFAATFIPPLYGFCMGIFSTYAGFADFLTAVFIVPLMLYWLTKEKKYIFCALWLVLSTVLQSVRTGMGGMMLVFCIALLLKNKAKAIPGLAVAGAMFLSVVLFVPEVNEKFFGEDAGTVSASDIVQGDAMSLENIETSGREGTWKLILDQFYHGREVRGSGLGVSIRYLKDRWRYEGDTAGLIHNDYVQLLAETGYIGVSLLVLFYISVIFKVTTNVALRRSSLLVKLTGIMALPSLVGIAFSMYFDNVVSNSMQSMVMPYIYLGFFLKALSLEQRAVSKEPWKKSNGQ